MQNKQNKINIAIDGFSSCGKSTFAKLIAKQLNYLYIDSGAMYRSVALYALRNQLIKNGGVDEAALANQLKLIGIQFQNDAEGDLVTMLNNTNVEKEIRGKEVSEMVSIVSQLAPVREHLVNQQQIMGERKGVVMDGRDIGTVVFPNAEIKIFMNASAEVRAKRRYNELLEKGIEANYHQVLDNIETRDKNDLNRNIGPLKKAADALELDNGKMTIGQQMVWFKNILKEKGYL